VDERVVYLNGSFVAESTASVSVLDRAVMSGDGVYDVARTFGHRPNKLLAHCRRLVQSARYTRISVGLSPEELEKVCLELFDRNRHLLGANDDYITWIVVTRGLDPPTRNPLDAGKPTVIVRNVPPSQRRFARFYLTGVHLVTSSTRRTPPQCLDPRAKITNKMNHTQAEFEAKAFDPDAFPLMLDIDGNVAESSMANVFFVRNGRVFTPRDKNILLGIMRENVIENAAAANVEVTEGDFTQYDFDLADEIFLTTTSFSILPVSRFNGRELAAGVPGPVTSRLMMAWKRAIKMDFVEQALGTLSDSERRSLP
jgi:branched-chain amino acid aminotransferase